MSKKQNSANDSTVSKTVKSGITFGSALLWSLVTVIGIQ